MVTSNVCPNCNGSGITKGTNAAGSCFKCGATGRVPVYETGDGRKDDGQKAQHYELLPWQVLEEVVRVLGFGAKKYKANNWKLVDDAERRYLNAAYRHMAKIEPGTEALDEETGLSHYSHALCSLLFAAWHAKFGKK